MKHYIYLSISEWKKAGRDLQFFVDREMSIRKIG